MSHRPDLATLEHRSQQLGARMAATMAAIDRVIREASRLVAGRAPTLPRGVEALACDMCGCHSDVTEDSDDGARLCGDCRWEAEHPEQCPEPSGAGRCGARKEPTSVRPLRHPARPPFAVSAASR